MTEAERYLDQRLNNKNSNPQSTSNRDPRVEIPWQKLYWRGWENYAVFSGRARRGEYWIFVGINILVVLGLKIFDAWMGTSTLAGIFGLIVLVPSLAVGVRRLHDTDRPGVWILLGFVPLVNLVLLFFFCEEGKPGTNQYGVDPKELGRCE